MVELLENYVDKGKLTIVGDFNLDVGSDSDRYARNFVNECALLGLKQLVNVPTRSTLTSNTIIDLVFSNVELCIDVLSTPRVSDHNIIVINSDLDIEQNKKLRVTEKRNFNKFDLNTFCDIFVDRYKLDINDDIDVVFNKFSSSVTYALDVVVPKTAKILKPKCNDKKWITKDLIEKIKERDRLFFVSKKFGREDDIIKYKRLRNYIVNELRKCKREHNDNNIDANKNNGKILWRELKELIGSKKAQSTVENIECDNKILDDNLVISNKFNHYFVDSINKIVNEIGFNQLKDVVNDNSNNQKWNSFDRVYVNDLDKIIQSLDNRKGSNNDVNSVILKHLWNFDKNSVLDIINRSLESGVVPDCLKVSRIVPIQKIKDSIKITDFRPINTLPVLEQVLESIVKSQLNKFIVENEILNEEQSGFRKEHSCDKLCSAL
ncbi:uncharacterized protein LOC128667989 [Microplitis demolitor]|uniref:uncharacterized protein LOC128667989 n=1 Tax=Microplitis demolitor TaxID=69319 RepID=UPI00235B66BB|nr:uncharacterized protein LOC128667989 [Microplitis demolitor]